MVNLGWSFVGVGLAVALYAYVGYPAVLWLLGKMKRPASRVAHAGEPPLVTVTIPVYNEAHNIADVLDRVLASDYPRDRLQVLVISDASTDGTDEIVRSYVARGVELVRLKQRGGKTAAENASHEHARGEIIVNTDASVRIHPDAIRHLVAAFADPTVGVASGRDVSVTHATAEQTSGESGYVGYEMWVRQLETAVSGIVGASGCLFANRADLHRERVPAELSRDFAAPLIAREHGYRAVSVHEAVCHVPRTASLHREYRRKVRTMTRGLTTLAFKRQLLNPFRYGGFAWMLFSHKVCRWLVPWAGVLVLVGLAVLAVTALWARVVLGLSAALAVVAGIGWLWPKDARLPRLVALPTFAIAANIAALHSTLKALGGGASSVWEPTRREADGPQMESLKVGK